MLFFGYREGFTAKSYEKWDRTYSKKCGTKPERHYNISNIQICFYAYESFTLTLYTRETFFFNLTV